MIRRPPRSTPGARRRAACNRTEPQPAPSGDLTSTRGRSSAAWTREASDRSAGSPNLGPDLRVERAERVDHGADGAGARLEDRGRVEGSALEATAIFQAEIGRAHV